MNDELLEMTILNPFLFYKKTDFNLEKLIEITDDLRFETSVIIMHPSRKHEYILSRIMIHLLFKNNFNIQMTSFENAQDQRAPKWPKGFVGSISHSKEYILVVANSQKKYIGIDIEDVGRVKIELKKYIINESDISEVDNLDQDSLSTLIFSAKESLFKALNPITKIFFGFEDASVTSINLNEMNFKIQLHKELSNEFGPFSKCIFNGRFLFMKGLCITIIDE